jgi:hypothetical protein
VFLELVIADNRERAGGDDKQDDAAGSFDSRNALDRRAIASAARRTGPKLLGGWGW